MTVARPLIGDEGTIEKRLFGQRVSREDMTMEQRWALDARMKRGALLKGFDSIVLMTPKAFSDFKVSGKLPRSMELNILSTEGSLPRATRRRAAPRHR